MARRQLDASTTSPISPPPSTSTRTPTDPRKLLVVCVLGQVEGRGREEAEGEDGGAGEEADATAAEGKWECGWFDLVTEGVSVCA